MEEQTKETKKSNLREWVESFVIAAVLALFLRSFVIQAFKIPSGSMRPTLIEGDRLMVNKLRYGPKLTFRWGGNIVFSFDRLPGFGEPKIGDIIVFIYPEDPKRDFIKRLVALEGDRVEIRAGDIFVNGEKLDEARIDQFEYYNFGPYGQQNQVVTVPEDHVFVLGDNSGSSHDSRYWGFVPEENIIGRAEFIYWPFNRAGVLK